MLLLLLLVALAKADVDSNDEYFERLEYLPSQALRAPFYPGEKGFVWGFFIFASLPSHALVSGKYVADVAVRGEGGGQRGLCAADE